MATYSNNTTIKFSSGVVLTGNSSYTVPANSYVIISWIAGGTISGAGTSASVSIDGITVFSSNNGSVTNSLLYEKSISHYVPAGRVISTSVSGGGKASTYVLMNLFQNTP